MPCLPLECKIVRECKRAYPCRYPLCASDIMVAGNSASDNTRINAIADLLECIVYKDNVDNHKYIDSLLSVIRQQHNT